MSSKRRKRGICLTKHAADQLWIQAEQRWLEQNEHRRPSREGIAEMLGLSIATMEKLVACAPVDRATAIIAFRAVGMEWTEELVDSGEAPKPLTESAPSSSKTKFPIRFILVGLAAIAFAAGLNHQLAVQIDSKIEAGMQDFQRGDFGSARANLAVSYNRAKDQDSMEHMANTVRLDADLCSSQGDFVTAKRKYLLSLQMHEQLGQLNYRASLFEAIGDCELRLGDLDSSEEHFSQSAQLYNKANDPTGVAIAKRGLGSVYHARKESQRAVTTFDAALADINGLDKPDLKSDLAARRALAISDLGQPQEALKTLNQCLDYWTSKDHPRWIATTRLQLAKVYRTTGEKEAAEQMARSAQSTFQSVGDKAGVANCEELLQSIQ